MTLDRRRHSQLADRAAAGWPDRLGAAKLLKDLPQGLPDEVHRFQERPIRVRGRRPLLELLRRRKSRGGWLGSSTMVPPQTRGRGRGEDELSLYIEQELETGRNLFDVLGDRNVWTKLEDDPLLLSRVLPKSEGGVAR